MTNYLFNQILSYQTTALNPIFASISVDFVPAILHSFFDNADADDLLDDNKAAHAALAYIQEHTEKLLLLSAETGEILMEIPINQPTGENTTALGIYI